MQWRDVKSVRRSGDHLTAEAQTERGCYGWNVSTIVALERRPWAGLCARPKCGFLNLGQIDGAGLRPLSPSPPNLNQHQNQEYGQGDPSGLRHGK
jgi:hypothetical protein